MRWYVQRPHARLFTTALGYSNLLLNLNVFVNVR